MANTTKRAATDKAVYQFSTSQGAWAFMRECDAAGISAGFPGLKDYTVQVAIPSWQVREQVDAFAGRQPISYTFAGQAS